MAFVHKSVLFEESIDALNIQSSGVYMDLTAGGGGHSAAILDRLTSGRLICVDQDPDAIDVLRERFAGRSNVSVVQSNFSRIRAILEELELPGVDGVLMDIGVSSYQLDTPERGFSFHSDAPLDMRMSRSGMSAADVVNSYSEQELRRVIRDYGEERFAGAIAREIVRARQRRPIQTTFELIDVIKSAMPAAAQRDAHPARRTFQAIRIEVNNELGVLSDTLDSAFDVLHPHGRLAVITFHSLEDRMVKTRFAQFCQGCTCPKDFPVCVCGKKPRGRLVFKSKAPTAQELEANPRSHSARLRCVEKLEI
ncbi:MAG: 16S rRNA (cytosine(1402)-N(4))-methyltransferase RsmH [Clostridia bacterium]